MNIVVIEGLVTKQPTVRELRSGDRLVSFDVRVPSRPAQSVPVTWIGATSREPNVSEGDAVVVVGAVHRRFYRSGGQLGSRVDVRAERIARGGPARRRRAIQAAADRLAVEGHGATTIDDRLRIGPSGS